MKTTEKLIPLMHISDFNNEWNRRALDLSWRERTAIQRGPGGDTKVSRESAREPQLAPVTQPGPPAEREPGAKAGSQ